MPYQVIYLDNQQGVLVQRWGNTNEQEYQDLLHELVNDAERLSQLRYLLLDYSNANMSYVKPRHARQAAQDVRQLQEANSEVVLAVISDNFFFRTMARIWQAMHEDLGIRSTIVGNLAQAKHWVNEQSQQTFLFQGETSSVDPAKSSSG